MSTSLRTFATALAFVIATIVSPRVASGQFAVTPYGAAGPPEGGQVTFTIYNDREISDTWVDTFELTCDGTGGVDGCQSDYLVSVWRGSSADTDVSFSTGGPRGPSSVGLTAYSPHEMGSYDRGWYDIDLGAAVTYTVAVTPDGQSVAAMPEDTASQSFTVTNTGTNGGTYVLSAVCTPPATTSCIAPEPVVLSTGASTTVNVTYRTGELGQTGTVRLRATYSGDADIFDEGTANVTTAWVAPASTLVTVVNANPGTNFDRDLCVTVGVGSASAAECGDLRVAHGLPAVTTLNTSRAPTLLYNSRHAQADPVLGAFVTLAAGAPTPTRVTASLLVKPAGAASWGDAKATGEWGGAEFIPGRPARIALSYDAGATATQLLDYRFDVTVWNGGTPQPTTSASGQFVLVNRSQSPLGAGWWLAGLERLILAGDASIAWVGGDGSTRRYVPVPGQSNTWAAAALDRPDTLKKDASSGRFTRALPHGVRVQFDTGGRHDTTVNRLGYKTAFTYDASGRPWKITVPKWSGPTYELTYVGSDTVRVTAPSADGVPRVVVLRLTSGTLRSIVDADTTAVGFEYDPTASRRISARVDRRNVRARFSYAPGGVVEYARLDSATNLAWREGHLISVAETRGLAPPAGTGQAVPITDVYTKYDGPRSGVVDHSTVWTTALGAPRKIQDALGAKTVLTRGDTRFPTLVTEVRAPNGLTTQATYDARGNLLTSTAVNPLGDGRNATTSYEWDSVWDFATKVTLPAGEVSTTGYASSNGNRLWQQDGRGIASRVDFAYYDSGQAAGLMRAAQIPGSPTARDSLEYDPTLANLSASRTAMGFWTSYARDPIGRLRVVTTQMDTIAATVRRQDSLYYDLNDQVIRSVKYGPAYNGTTEQRLIVRNYYDDEGDLLQVERESDPQSAGVGVITNQWVIDPVGRWRVEVAPDGQRDSTVSDAAGNPIQVFTRRRNPDGARHVISMQYDVLNRLIQRDFPSVPYPERAEGIGAAPGLEGLANTPYGGFTVDGDTARYWYNAITGLLDSATNAAAKVRRGYLPSGLVSWDSLRINGAQLGSTNFNLHRYGLAFTYDLNGRRTQLQHPEQLAARVGSTVYRYTNYGYDPVTGRLKTVVDPLGKTFTYAYNMRNEVESLTLPWGTAEQFTYDNDGRLRTHVLGSRRSTTLTYDAEGRLLISGNTVQLKDSIKARYSGLGHLAWNRYTAHGINTSGNTLSGAVDETFYQDALANVYKQVVSSTLAPSSGFQSSTTPHWSIFESATGRQFGDSSLSRVDSTVFDSSGNAEFRVTKWTQSSTSPPTEDRASFYAADGRLRFADYRWMQLPHSEGSQWTRAFEEYRYDPFGRRVFVDTEGTCHRDVVGGCRMQNVRRTVWDGDAELYEIQMPYDGLHQDDDTTTFDVPPDVAGDHAPTFFDRNPFFGRVAYTYGLALDQPLSITRIGFRSDPWVQSGADNYAAWDPFTIVPHWNYRGEADLASYGDGAITKCMAPPGKANRCAEVHVAFGAYALQREQWPWTPWHGTLMSQKEDGAHTLYRRNRYYDPASGRFTQEDPIGLAGGLNLYGFANGDPVNFSDPFGLCAESLRDESGNCPGGLTVRQWERIEYAANNRMTAEARDIVLDLLQRGRISVVKQIVHNGKPQAGQAFAGSGRVVLSESTLRYQIGDLAYALAHEAIHTTQLKTNPTLREPLAEAYACANTWGRKGYFAGGYRQTLGPCGSGAP